MRIRVGIWVVSVLLASAYCAAAQPGVGQYDWKSWGAVADTFVVKGSQNRITLTSPFVVEQSERVTVGGRVVATTRYEINYQRGLVRFLDGVPEGETVVVSYIRKPFLLNSVYSLRDIEFSDGQDAVPVRSPQIKKREPLFNPAGNLAFGGFKSISLSVGSNRGASLDQTLQASVEGDLTSSIHVKALLSDNNLPIQPEGNTEELEYLDKVFVEFTGPKARAVLGDFSARNDYSGYTAFRRELKGASGEVNVVDSKVGVAAGSSKGVFRTLTFRGTDQLQGPYELIPQGRLSGEVIIAGTERVYVDGAPLQRGQNRDYTIDYDAGTLTFTPRRPITADTEISVDIQVTQEAYDRTSVFGNAETALLPGGFNLLAMVAQERDDANRPKSLTLEEEDREALAGAGDDGDLAISGGIVFLGSGNGEYERVAADSIMGVPEHFVFNDSTGAYSLSFVNVGPQQGDYVLDGVTAKGRPIYRFADPGGGNFVIGKELPLPQSHRVMTTRLTRGGDRHVTVDFQFNVSEFDANTLSSLDDGDNVGDAGELKIGLRKIPAGLGRLDLTGSFSTLQDRFRSLDKARRAYFYRDWTLEGVELRGREVLQEITSAFSRGERLRLEYDFGTIRRDDFDGSKQEGRLSVSRLDDQVVSGRVFSTHVEGGGDVRTRQHATTTLSYGFWGIVPTALVSHEEFLVRSQAAPDSGTAYEKYLVRLAKRRVDRFSFSLEAEERNTDEFADTTGGWVDSRRDRTYGLSLMSRGSTLQGELTYTHRIQDNWIIGGRTASDLARLKGLFRVQKIGLHSNFDYQISQNQFRSQQRSVVFVGEGQGDYNRFGEPVGKGRGDHTVVYLPTQQVVPTTNVGLTWTLSWRAASYGGGGGGALAWISRNVSLDQSFSVREESTFEDPYKVYLLFPSALQRNGSTLYGIMSLRQDWTLLGGYPNVSLTVRYQRDDEEENRFDPVKEDRLFEQYLIRVDRSISKLLSANIEGRRESRKRGGAGMLSGTGSTYDVTGWAVSAGWGLRFSAGTTLDGDIEYKLQDDAESDARERSIGIRPRFVWRLSKLLNVFGRYEMIHFLDEEETLVKPTFFSNRGTTHRWGLTPNLRLNKWISFLATYEGRNEDTFLGNRITEHDFRIETRAFF